VDRYTTMVALAAILSGTFLIVTLITSIARVASSRRRDTAALPDASTSRIEERLSRIEQAVDAIAVEVERVSEGQRFTTKLLSDRVAERVART
jgi:hypothetical protein